MYGIWCTETGATDPIMVQECRSADLQPFVRRWKLVYENWCRETGVRKLVYGNWCTETGLRKLVYGNWFTESGLLKLVYGNWCRETGLRKLVYGNWCSRCNYGAGVQKRRPPTIRQAMTRRRCRRGGETCRGLIKHLYRQSILNCLRTTLFSVPQVLFDSYENR